MQYNTYFRHQSLAYEEQMKELVVGDQEKTSDVSKYLRCLSISNSQWILFVQLAF